MLYLTGQIDRSINYEANSSLYGESAVRGTARRGRARRDSRHYAARQADRRIVQPRCGQPQAKTHCARWPRSRNCARQHRRRHRRRNSRVARRRPKIVVPFVLDASVVGVLVLSGRNRCGRDRERWICSIARATIAVVPAASGGLKFATSMLLGERREAVDADNEPRFSLASSRTSDDRITRQFRPMHACCAHSQSAPADLLRCRLSRARPARRAAARDTG